MRRADIKVLDAAADVKSADVLARLLKGPASQRELAEAIGLDSSAISKRMAKLEDAGLVFRERSHGPYDLHQPVQVRALLEAAADLGAFAARLIADEAETHRRRLRRDGMEGGRLRDERRQGA